MSSRPLAVGLAAAFLIVFLLTPPGRLALDAVAFVPQSAWGWVVGFVALLGFVFASRSALRRPSSR